MGGGKAFEQPDKKRELTRQEKQDIEVFGRVREQTQSKMVAEFNYTVESWALVDEMLGAVRVQRPATASQGVAIGRLVAIRIGDTGAFYLGALSELAHETDGRIIATVTIFPGKPEPLAVRAGDARNRANAQWTQGFRLPALEKLAIPASLVVPSGMGTRGRGVEVWNEGAKESTVEDVLERGGDFDRVTTSWDPTAPRSSASIRSFAALSPVCCAISTMHVGLVTLISVSQSPITSRPAKTMPAFTSSGPTASPISRSRAEIGCATPVPPAARLPRVSPAFGMRARQWEKGLPSITSTRLSPFAISGMKRCAMMVRLPRSVMVSTITLRFTSSALTRKDHGPAHAVELLHDDVAVGVDELVHALHVARHQRRRRERGKARIASFSFQSRSARGLFTTRVPSASTRSRRSVA